VIADRSILVRLRALRRRSIVAASTGKRLGRVAEVLVDLTGRRVIGFRLRHGGILDRRWRVAALEDISELTDSAVVLPDAIALREDDTPSGCVTLYGNRLPVRDATGAVIGDLVDAEADLATGQLFQVFVAPHAHKWLRPARQEALPPDRLRVERDGSVIEGSSPSSAGGDLAASG
jgi:sporulation protein YlmC with PRC-barrel domain